MRNALCAAIFLCAGALATAQTAPPEVVRDLAPTGRLRAAINLANSVLAHRDTKESEPTGVSVDLARELGKRLGVPVEFVIYHGAGTVFHSAGGDRWDIGFFALDPERAPDVDYTAPYVIIQGGYIVRKDSSVWTIADADRPGARIVVGKDSVYDLYLTRTLKHAELVRVSPAGLPTVLDKFFHDKLEVAAFISIPLARYAEGNPNMRMIDGSFMEIDQAIATPKARGQAGRRYLKAFVEEMKASGFVEAALVRSGQGEAVVAPPASQSHAHYMPAAYVRTGPADAAPDQAGAEAVGTCELLPPWFRTDATKVVREKIGPKEASPTGNTYFFMPRPVKHVIVHIEPTTSDTAPYVVKLITRYTDDTIFEPIVETIVPTANKPLKWGPIPVMARKVPKNKVADTFNVKVQENYAMDPGAKGFSYGVWVEGCN